MPFSSQPRKKGTPEPQAGTHKLACGHTAPKNDCAVCQKSKPAPKLVDAAKTKQELIALREKVADKFIKDPKASDKAAFILSLWIKDSDSKKRK